jgi:shikimate kinase
MRSIFLIGLMGAGKTTVGRHLAEALGRPFLDSDHVIEERAGAKIPWIFDVEGEAGFRDREVAVIDDLTRREGIVLATGGGVVLRDENRRVLRERGTVIYLHGSVEHLYHRTSRDRRRPLLQQGDRRATLQRLLTEREPLYRETAHHVFVSDRRPARALAEEIRHRLGLADARAAPPS